MIAADNISINEADAEASGMVISRQNRNLSSVICTIRDDGPSTSASPLPDDAAVNDTNGVPDPAPAAKPDTAAPVTRVRALPGKAVMLRVLAVLLFSGLVAGTVLLANGKYPSVDDRGLYLAALPADLPDRMVAIKTDIQDKLLQWQEQAGAMLSATPTAATPAAPQDPLFVAALAERQQLISTRLEELADSIDILQLRFEQAQAAGAVDSVTLQAGQAQQLEAVAAQLADLQQQVAGTRKAEPRPTDKEGARQRPPVSKKQQPVTVAGTGSPTPASDTAGAQQPSATESVAVRASTAGPAGEPAPVAATAAPAGWVVNVASSSQLTSIEALQRKLRQQDIRTELQHLGKTGASRYRLRVTGFTSGGEARRYAAGLAQKAGIEGAWVSKR